MPRDARQQAIVDSREALYGRTTYYAGPIPSYISTNPAANLSPGKIASIHSEVLVAGYMVNKACLDEQIWKSDAHLRAVDTARRVASVGKPFSVEPCDYPDQELAQWVADYMHSVVDGIAHFDRSMKQLLRANSDGYALQEIVWQDRAVRFPIGRNRVATVFGPHPQQMDWVHNKHTRFDVDTDRILLDMGRGAFIELPEHKFVLHELSEDFQKRVRGYMYPIVWLHMIKQQAVMRWSNVLEIWGIPVPHGKVDQQLWQDLTRREEYRQMLVEAGLGKPFLTTDDFSIEPTFQISGGDARGMHAAIIGWVDQTISKVVQGETLTTELGGVGSYNASETHAAVKESIVAMDALDLANTVRDTLFRAILKMNAPALAEALGRSPEEIMRCLPWPYWRIEREVTPQVRMDIIKSAVNDLAMDIDAPSIYREMGLPRARDKSRRLRGEPTTMADGAKTVGSVEAAAGSDNPKDPTTQAAPKPVNPTPAPRAEEQA